MSSTEILSDKSVIESTSAVVARRRNYADLDLRFRIHPERNDVRPVLDIDAVKNSVRNLILTNRLERPFQPEVGSNLTAYLFELADPITTGGIRNEIRRTIENNEPRVVVNNIDIRDLSDRNAYFVSIEFTVVNLNTDANIELYLERVK